MCFIKLIEKVNAIQTTDASHLVKKTDHGKYITTQEVNKLTAKNFAARLKEENIATKADIDDFVEKKMLMIN